MEKIRYCEECKTPNEADFKYCKTCGTLLCDEETVQVPEFPADTEGPDSIDGIPLSDLSAFAGKKRYRTADCY